MDSLTARFHKDVFLPYVELLKAKYRFHRAFGHAKNIWEERLTAKELVNGPYLEKSQVYKEGAALDQLPLHEKTKATIRKRLGERTLWKHQTDALQLVLNGKNTVIATGTSSGKTLCYQIPILDDLLRNPSAGLRAVIIYPLNALVNDQLTEWELMLADHPQINFARFTGQTPDTQTDYVRTLRETFREEMADAGLTQHDLQQKVEQRVAERLKAGIPNRLNHRDQIRSNPPQVLVTNFSMLEYLLERPVDAPIFENARLKFLVLDEAHAYRGVQATEIAFLVRRLKDRLGIKKLACIATSATLGKQGDAESETKVRRFASDLFGEDFSGPNPIYETPTAPALQEPAFSPTPAQYVKAAEAIRHNRAADVRQHLGVRDLQSDLGILLTYDQNLYRLRKDVLSAKPTLLKDAARLLWPDQPQAEEGIEALLEVAAVAKSDQSHEDLLPTRLHYFVRAQDGLHICVHKACPGRRDGRPAFFVSRKTNQAVPEGECPDCYGAGRTSRLIEVVSCRKCGYLFGALQDLGPRRAQNPDGDGAPKPYFDSFSTELGWTSDSFWSYLSVDEDLPYPYPLETDDEADQDDLFVHPAELEWCVACGKKKEQGAGDNCTCDHPHLRTIKIFHRQCAHRGRPQDHQNLYRQDKSLLSACPNCGSRNGSGIEPLQRFQESDDEVGLAMAVPLAHFSVSPGKATIAKTRKLLCFTDHRQRAAAFPSLLEEETFLHDMGRRIVKVLDREKRPLAFVTLGEQLADEESSDSQFFLPVSRFPDEELDAKGKRDLWIAETFGYFGVPDSARESAEDFGLVAVDYSLADAEKMDFRKLLGGSGLSAAEADSVLQVLLSFMRQRKAFTLPKGRVQADAPAFGRVTADIAYVLRRQGIRNTNGWLPQKNSSKDNIATDYMRRALRLPRDQVLILGEKIWELLTDQALLIESKGTWKLDHERLFVFPVAPGSRYACNRCGIVSAYSARNCCPRKECEGLLEQQAFDSGTANIIARWVSAKGEPQFSTLKSEEHTAQIDKNLAKRIEDKFRDEGVNLLSSTTTFEMGINIGDLQKVLLRNAPPSSASYVQRVGRAGRGKEKNSVCVTLCRRTKYDADAWNDPLRLMSGAVRAPTVFIQNKVIAQRHCNAQMFSKFLRIRIADEHVLGQPGQQIRLEAFLPPESRQGVPESWFRIRPSSVFLDFLNWLTQQAESDIVLTQSGRALVTAVSGFDTAVAQATAKYQQIFKNIEDELSTLMAERQKLFQRGAQISDIEQAIQNLLGSDVIALLAKRGFLPRYAFPLDVVTLETGTTRWSRDLDVELSRDRGIAIAEFAPSAQVIAHKKVFTSNGLYVCV
jgi:DEAD/DEAH box helicase/Helicase conserved C-terminal domain